MKREPETPATWGTRGWFCCHVSKQGPGFPRSSPRGRCSGLRQRPARPHGRHPARRVVRRAQAGRARGSSTDIQLASQLVPQPHAARPRPQPGLDTRRPRPETDHRSARPEAADSNRPGAPRPPARPRAAPLPGAPPLLPAPGRDRHHPGPPLRRVSAAPSGAPVVAPARAAAGQEARAPAGPAALTWQPLSAPLPQPSAPRTHPCCRPAPQHTPLAQAGGPLPARRCEQPALPSMATGPAPHPAVGGT